MFSGLIQIVVLLANALDEYAALKSRGTKTSKNESQMDPRLEGIVERMLDKYVRKIFTFDVCLLLSIVKSLIHFVDSGAFQMANTSKPWECQLNVGD